MAKLNEISNLFSNFGNFLQVTHTIFQYLVHVSQGSGGDADPLIRGFSFNNNQ